MSIEIIAEVGVNHDGSPVVARDLIKSAARAGCDTVKLQHFDSRRSYGDDRVSFLQMPKEELRALKEHAGFYGVQFLCTPDDLRALDEMIEAGCQRIKIGSSNVTNLPLIRAAAESGLPILLSTGACTWHEVCEAFGEIRRGGARHRTTIMHCVSSYPAELAGMNLMLVRKYAGHFRVPVGLSDHTLGHEAAVMAVAQGAVVIEKHLTHNPRADGPDHAMSLGPGQMKLFVDMVRDAGRAMGLGEKYVLDGEQKNRSAYLKFVARQMPVREAV